MWIEYLLLFLMHIGEYSKYIKYVGKLREFSCLFIIVKKREILFMRKI